MPSGMRRREFLARAAMTFLGCLCFPRVLVGGGESRSTVVVAHGEDCASALTAGIKQMGGWQAFVKAGMKTVLKPNAAWACGPETGANTSPQLVERCVCECLKAGASEVVVPENPCSPARYSFEKSGIEEAVRRAGGRMYAPSSPGDFRRVEIPLGKSLASADIVRDVVDCACLINMPVAKTHGGTMLTLSMKNWMGSVKDRGAWHRSDLDQCIADMSTFLKPALIIVDAMRIMVSGGPRGPGKLRHPNQLVLGTDPVAVDAYAATVFGKNPFDVRHIRLAHEMGIGCGDLDRVNVVHVG